MPDSKLAEKLGFEIRGEIYRAFVLMGAEMDLLSLIGSWGDTLPDDDVLDFLKQWNEATIDEVRGRIKHYGDTFKKLAADPERKDA